MQNLFSPWRSKYISTFSVKNEDKKCVLCEAIDLNDDDKSLIIWREKHTFTIMNLFPYNSGHLMIVPYRHISKLDEISDSEFSEITKTLSFLSTILKKVLHAEGFNIGCNIGRVAGAGIDTHIHFHIVPRWNGDTNFFPIFSDTKVISEDMKETLKKIRNEFLNI